MNVNMSDRVGEDATMFNADRWIDSSIGTDLAIPGPYGGILTFGSDNRACV